MAINLAQAHGWVQSELARHRSSAESMSILIDKCEKAHPHSDWQVLRSLPFGDLSPLLNWLRLPFQEEPATSLLRGLWFGLFNPCRDDGSPTADIYVCGSDRFDPDPEDNNWAVGPDWWPESRYALSTVLDDVYRIAYRQNRPAAEQNGCLGNDAEYPMCLGYGCFAVRETLTLVEPSLILGKSDALGIAVGFDSGDFVLLGEFTKDGLSPTEKTAPSEARIAQVVEELRSSESRKVFRAVIGLQRFGTLARQAVPDLLRIIGTSEEVALRQFGLNTLVAIAPDDPSVKTAVFDAFSDGCPFVRREALQAAISITNPSASDLARIKDMEDDPDDAVSRWSEIALRNIRINAKKESQDGDD